MHLRVQALELYVRVGVEGWWWGLQRVCVNIQLMQMADVGPLCPEGKPFGSSAFFAFLFTILIYVTDLRLRVQCTTLVWSS